MKYFRAKLEFSFFYISYLGGTWWVALGTSPMVHIVPRHGNSMGDISPCPLFSEIWGNSERDISLFRGFLGIPLKKKMDS